MELSARSPHRKALVILTIVGFLLVVSAATLHGRDPIASPAVTPAAIATDWHHEVASVNGCEVTNAGDLLDSGPSSKAFWVALLQSPAVDSLASATNTQLYSSDSWGFAIRYPATWRLRATGIAGGGTSLAFFAPTSDSSGTERNLLLLNVTDVPDSAGQNPPVVSTVSLARSTMLRLLITRNHRYYGFSDTFATVTDEDAVDIATVIRSLTFNCS